jgi:hypothetical protein
MAEIPRCPIQYRVHAVLFSLFLNSAVTSVIETPGNQRSHRSIAKIAGIESQNLSPQIYADERRWEKPNTETETREKQNPHHCTDNNGQHG